MGPPISQSGDLLSETRENLDLGTTNVLVSGVTYGV
jgi:hypothetical protein